MAAFSSLIKKNRYQLINLHRIIKAQSSFKIVFTLCFALFFEVGLFWLFLDGFNFLHRMGGVGLIIISKLFDIFFLGMGFMLIVSSIVSSYSTIYRSDEIPFLLTRPFSISQIVLYKFFESTGLSSWAFFFIIIPFICAYGYHENMSAAFVVWNFLFSIPFLITCSGIGTVITIIIVRWIPLGRYLRIPGIGIAVIAAWFLIHELLKYRSITTESDLNLSMLLPGFTLASNPLLPSYWISEGIMLLTGGQWLNGVMFGIMITSTSMVICISIEWVGQKIFHEGWQRLTNGSSINERAPVMLWWLQNILLVFPSDIRAIVMKDIRTFFRDPVQWSQALIFFGLLALYFSNLRTFRYHTFPENWRNTIAFLNVFSVSAVICSLGARFIYPQLSLEGQGFWILGLSPARMSRILLTKFFLALSCMLLVSTSLMFLSARMLNAAPIVVVVAILLVCSISAVVCGLSTGLGAIYLDISQKNPAAIVSGFGGTLNLVLSLCFMLVAIIPFGMIFHLNLLHRMNNHQMYNSLIIAGLWLVVLTVLSIITPLYLGLKTLLRREY
ncbi:MAG: hypothetical protein PHI84_11105 [Kiritimatiellae bacterium]|nr:hypothetical protein [Kiritimatiellia bacterium]